MVKGQWREDTCKTVIKKKDTGEEAVECECYVLGSTLVVDNVKNYVLARDIDEIFAPEGIAAIARFEF